MQKIITCVHSKLSYHYLLIKMDPITTSATVMEITKESMTSTTDTILAQVMEGPEGETVCRKTFSICKVTRKKEFCLVIFRKIELKFYDIYTEEYVEIRMK